MSSANVPALASAPSALSEVLRKHVAAVHSTGALSFVERKITNVLLLNAYDDLVGPDGRAEARHTIPLRYLASLVGWEDSKNLNALKDAIRSLQKTTLEFDLMHETKGAVWESMPMLSYVRLEGGACIYGYPSELAKRLHDPDVFALINIGVQRNLKGAYALALYENCVRYRRTKSTGWWDLEKFRRLVGAEASMYDEFKRLSSFVIKRAVEEINTSSDIFLTADYQREGRKVVSLRFLIEENPQGSLFGPNPLDDAEITALRGSRTYKRLREHGIGERLALATMRHDPDLARSAVEKAEEKDAQGLIQSSTGAYIKALIDVKAELGPTSYQQQKTERVAETKLARKRAAAQGRLDELEADYREKQIMAWVKNLDGPFVASKAQEFIETGAAKESPFDKIKGKFDRPTAQVAFRSWLMKHAPVDLSGLDAFITAKRLDPAQLRIDARVS